MLEFVLFEVVESGREFGKRMGLDELCEFVLFRLSSSSSWMMLGVEGGGSGSGGRTLLNPGLVLHELLTALM